MTTRGNGSKTMAWLSALLMAGAVGCKEKTDIGNPCRLMRPDPNDSSKLVNIPSGDPALDPKFDFISFGDSDCENLVCIRQHATDYSSEEGDGVARGYCSNSCLDQNDCGEPEKGYQCQQILLDQQFLDGLKKNDPTTYAQYFGDSSGNDYCAPPGAAADGGA